MGILTLLGQKQCVVIPLFSYKKYYWKTREKDVHGKKRNRDLFLHILGLNART